MAGLAGEASFERDIRPLFREEDHEAMDWLLDLWSYDDVKAHAGEILAQLQAGAMPCDGAWPTEQVALFQRWAEGAMAP
jgi:hypothetical protein